MIRRKKKICTSCKNEEYIFSSHLCKICFGKLHTNPLKARSIINKISKIGIERNNKYKILRDEYMKNHPICEFEGCNNMEITLHHKSGRIGENLFKDFCSLCMEHHNWVHDNPKEAKELKLL